MMITIDLTMKITYNNQVKEKIAISIKGKPMAKENQNLKGNMRDIKPNEFNGLQVWKHQFKFNLVTFRAKG